MSRACTICGKKTEYGNKISHANNKTRTRWYPNVKRVRSIIKGTIKTITVCTRCIRSGFVTKPA